MPSVLVVCLGNICRSPLAEGLLRREAEKRGLPLVVDSAGTGDWHKGSLPDERASAEGSARGCDMTMRARQIRSADFQQFDLILAMDSANYRDLLRLAGENRGKVRMIRAFDPSSPSGAEVPDPYYDGPAAFTEVADMLERTVDGVFDKLFPNGPSK